MNETYEANKVIVYPSGGRLVIKFQGNTITVDTCIAYGRLHVRHVSMDKVSEMDPSLSGVVKNIAVIEPAGLIGKLKLEVTSRYDIFGDLIETHCKITPTIL